MIAFSFAIRAGRFSAADAAFAGIGDRREKSRNEERDGEEIRIMKAEVRKLIFMRSTR